MDFHQDFKKIIHEYVRQVYNVTKNFPKNELYGVVSQLRRAAVSVILNYIEGYARRSGEGCKAFNNFIKTAYGSLKESEYLIFLSFEEGYLNKEQYDLLSKQANRIGGMLYGIMTKNK